MSDFEKRKKEVLGPVYFEAGAALFDCQSFEYGIAYILYLFSRLGTDELQVELTVSIMEDEAKKTSGQLIGLLKKHVKVSNSLENELAKGLEARNKLVHRYLVDNVERIADPDEHGGLIKDIRSLRAQVRSASEKLEPFTRALVSMTDGLDLDEFGKDAKEKFMSKTNA